MTAVNLMQTNAAIKELLPHIAACCSFVDADAANMDETRVDISQWQPPCQAFSTFMNDYNNCDLPDGGHSMVQSLAKMP